MNRHPRFPQKQEKHKEFEEESGDEDRVVGINLKKFEDTGHGTTREKQKER